MLARTGSTDRSAARGRALFGAGVLAWAEGDFEAASLWTEECLSIWRESGDKRFIAYSELWLGLVRLSQGNIAAALPLFEESGASLKDVGDIWGEAFTLFEQGNAAYFSGDLSAARAHFEESLRLFRRQGDMLYIFFVLNGLQVVVSAQGDEQMARTLSQQLYSLMQQARNRGVVGLILINTGNMWLHHFKDKEQAKVLFREGLSLWQDLQRVEHGMGIIKGLASLAEVAAAEGRAERAGRLFGAASHLLPPSSSYREDVNKGMESARVRLDAAAFEAGWTAGQAMTQGQAINEALGDV
jgi:tetratricopeptide (TPR) repeat protein